MPYLPCSLGADATPVTALPAEVTAQLQRIDDRTQQILASQAKVETRWKWQEVAAVVGSVFAAIKLGIIVIPTVRKQKPLGRLGQPPTKNPGRRRR